MSNTSYCNICGKADITKPCSSCGIAVCLECGIYEPNHYGLLQFCTEKCAKTFQHKEELRESEMIDNETHAELDICVETIRRNISEIIFDLLHSEDDYTVETLWNAVLGENTEEISRELYDYVIARHVKCKRILIEDQEPRYVSWIWNPKLIEELEEKELFL